MNAAFGLDGQVAIVTGGASGIGLATVKRLRDAGARVVMADLREGVETAESLSVVFEHVDVTKEESVQQLLQSTADHFGRLDILVNNAGVFADYKSIADSSSQDFEFCLEVNLMGAMYGIKHAADLMTHGGRVVSTASAAGVRGAVRLGSYVASKHAVVGLTKTAALELGAKNIRVNCVCPTTVNTPMAHTEGGEHLLHGERLLNPLGRICEPNEVAALIHFLVAPDCGFITGQAIQIDGGSSVGTTAEAFDKLLS